MKSVERRVRKASGADKTSDAPINSSELTDEGIDMATELSKEHQLRELLIAKNKLGIGSPDWLKVKQMIANITQAKKEEIQTEDNTIHYYLPLTCKQCSLYMESTKKK